MSMFNIETVEPAVIHNYPLHNGCKTLHLGKHSNVTHIEKQTEHNSFYEKVCLLPKPNFWHYVN